MNIAVIGTGYVGLTTGACFAEMGNQVFCHDIDEEKIKLLCKGKSPIFEKGLECLISRNLNDGRLHFTMNFSEVMRDAEAVFCAVPTPPDENMNADLSIVFSVARQFGQHIQKSALFIMKSTVPVGTNEKCHAIIQEELEKRGENIEFDVVSNPEFLRQGSAVEDTLKPDRIIIGAESDYAKTLMGNLYAKWIEIGVPFVVTSLKSAEMIKYAANAFLCTKISFINEIAGFCENVGCNISEIADGIGLDKRIGRSFLNAGIGYGGNCLKKDINALISSGKNHGYDMKILREVEKVNNAQRDLLVEKLAHLTGDLEGQKIAVFGLTFKAGTDDFRDAPSIDIIKNLLSRGVKIRLHDPLGTENFIQKHFPNIENISGFENAYEASQNTQAILVLTDWQEFQKLDFSKIANSMSGTLILDGRNMFRPGMIRNAGLQYVGIANF